MVDTRPYIELEFTGDTLTQSTSNTLIGTDIVIDYGDETTVNYNGDFSHSYSSSGTYTIRIYGVTSLDSSCFYECTGLTSVVIPESVTSLGNSCFSRCSGLTNVVISEGVTSLAPYCFYECTNLTSIVIPNTVTSIGDACFRGCASLTNIVIPDSVTSIGLYCFQVCTSLTSIVIPESITSLRGYCFEGCSSLTNIHLKWSSSTDIIQYDSYWVNNPDTNVKFIIPHGTTNLYTSKGYNSNKLKEQPDIPSLSIGSKTVKALQIGNKIIRSITRVSDELLLYHTPSWVSAEPSTIQEGDTTDVYADTPFSDDGYIVHFFERLTPTLHLTAEPSIIQTNEPTDVYARVTDSDGSRTGEGRMVYFFSDKDLRVPSVLNVSADKSILSYSDGDKAVLTATVLDGGDVPIANRSVVFKQGSTVLDTVITDSNGEAEYEYTSQGAGDVTLTVECMSLQETYSIQDCNLYDSTSHTGSDMSINVSLPSEFVITWESIRKSNSTSINKLNIGVDDNNMFQVGSYGSAGYNGLQERINGTWQTAQTTNNSPLNTIQYNTLRYENGSLSYSNGSQTVSKTPTVNLTKLLGYGIQANGVVQNIKVKPL